MCHTLLSLPPATTRLTRSLSLLFVPLTSLPHVPPNTNNNPNGWPLLLITNQLERRHIALATTNQMTTKPPPPPSSSSADSLDGLKFGQKIYFEDGSLATTRPKTSKKGRGGAALTAAAAQPPRCQVEGCKVDLTDAKAYYSRHKVCAMHSKSPTVVVAGMEQRFCQQCSRFHLLPEFDQGKRSCRRRLAGHNERRRKPPPSSILSSRYAKLSSPIYDYSGRSSGFLMEFSSYPKLTTRNPLPTLKSSQPVSENQTSTLTWQANSETPSDFFLQGSVGWTSFHGPRHPPVESYTGVADSSCALSLLSSQTWGPRNMEPSVELNNLLNFNGAPMTQLAASSHVAAIHQLPNSSWCFKDIDPSNCSHEAVPDIGLGQNAQPLHTHLPGELDVSQQGRRNYMDLGQSRAYESPHWSL